MFKLEKYENQTRLHTQSFGTRCLIKINTKTQKYTGVSEPSDTPWFRHYSPLGVCMYLPNLENEKQI